MLIMVPIGGGSLLPKTLRNGWQPEIHYGGGIGGATKDLAESFASGTTFLELSGAKAKQLPIPLAPLDQQKLIVAEIEKQFSRLDEAADSLKRAKANLKRYKAAVLKAAVEGKLTEEWRKADPDVEPADKLLKRILEERRRNWTGKGKYKDPAAPDTSNLFISFSFFRGN